MKDVIAVAGSIAQRPGVGGHTWVFLQYLLGFRRLGWDVVFIDRLEPGMCVDVHGRASSVEESINRCYLDAVMRAFGFGGSYALLHGDGHSIGLQRREVLERMRRSAFLLDVMGFLGDEEILGAAPKRVFLDIDPGFGQMWRELGLADPFAGYDAFVTIGERIGSADCVIPDCGLDWIKTRQPVVLAEWLPQTQRGEAFTSIGVWRGPYAPIEYRGVTYGLRAHEFRRFAALPLLSGHTFEAALEIHPDELRDLAMLAENGWTLVDPSSVAGNPHAYRDYVRRSEAELMVAKHIYVATRSGWFSDRSICYLASGRPVLAQDTGLDGLYPLGQGLVAFATLDEAVAGVEEITRHHRVHSRAARELAEEYFDSDKVLRRLLERLGA